MTYQHTVILSTDKEQTDLTHGSLFFIGTATVILRYAGFTILTDPNFLHQGDHIHLGYGLRSERLTNPAMEIKQLPPLDAVILSHLHEDHFDRVATRKLQKHLPIVTTEQAANALRKKGFYRAYPLPTWETLILEKGAQQLRVTAMPGKHGPGPLNMLMPSMMGSMLEFVTGADDTVLRLYITGDTLFNKALKEIPQRYPAIDLALLHLGGTRVLGVLLTMDAKQGVKVIKLVNPREAIPIHYDDYTVFKSPLEDFQQAVNDAHLTQRVHYLRHGESYTFEVPANRRH